MGKIYKQLSLEERMMVQTQLSMGRKLGQIAQEIGRSAGTLSRELNRYGWTRGNRPWGVGEPSVAGGYRAYAAQRLANSCTAKLRVPRKPRPDSALWEQITHYLQDDYSPNRCWHTGNRAS